MESVEVMVEPMYVLKYKGKTVKNQDLAIAKKELKKSVVHSFLVSNGISVPHLAGTHDLADKLVLYADKIKELVDTVDNFKVEPEAEKEIDGRKIEV